MKLYWRIRSLPELEHLTVAQRSQLLKHHVGWANCRLLFFALLIGLASMGCIASNLSWYIGAPAGIVLAAATYLLEIRHIRINIQMQIIELYRGKQLPICLKCGYDLREIDVSICPECGAPVHAKSKPDR